MTIAKSNDAPIVFADQQVPTGLQTDLKGAYQSKNLQTVQVALEQLSTKWNLDDHKSQEGLLNVVNNTKLLGRWQLLQKSPLVIADVGHNAEGLTYNMNQLQKEYQGRVFLMLGFVSDKNLESLTHLFPTDATYISCEANNLRSTSKQTLHNWFNNKQFNTKWIDGSIHEQLQQLMPELVPHDTLYIGGSTFVVAEIFDFFS
jgi:dihydrofolate synthase/folylpolyglutamate synthase